jgi:hypothetical protein
MKEARYMFIHSGFMPVKSSFEQIIPTLSSPKSGIFDVPLINALVEKMYTLNPIVEKIWPINKFCTSIFIAGRKVFSFEGDPLNPS